MIVYRVELKVKDKTYGPYLAAIYAPDDVKVRRAVNFFKNHASMMPEPHEDGIGFLPHHYVCGCRSLAQLFDWVAMWSMRELLDAGFTLSVYDVNADHVILGKTQLCFNPQKATLIKQLTAVEGYQQMEFEEFGEHA